MSALYLGMSMSLLIKLASMLLHENVVNLLGVQLLLLLILLRCHRSIRKPHLEPSRIRLLNIDQF